MIKLNNISKFYGQKGVIKDLSLDLEQNIINVVIGPSGSGKTTFLEMLANPALLTAGEIEISNKISYIFQEPRLLPNKTVYDNLDFVLKGIESDQSKRRERIERTLTLVDMVAAMGQYPRELSGGMAQRLAIARAFCFPSDILLMDEAFKSLDIKLKQAILRRFLRLWQEDRRTVVSVTHDIDEALLIADEIFVFSKDFKLKGRLRVESAVQKLDRDIMDESFLKLKHDIYDLL